MREAGAEIAGLLGGAVPATALMSLAADAAPVVRGAAGLLKLGTASSLTQAIAFAAGDGDPTARAEIAAGIEIARTQAEVLSPAIDAALAKIGGDDPAFEPLLRLKLATLVRASDGPTAIDVDAEISALFPSFAQMQKLAGFETLIRSLRTAEQLFQTSGAQADADLSPSITLWMKVLENYVHAWLGPRMAHLQREPAALFDYVDSAIGGGWGSYQRWLEPKWKDPVEVGGARVEVPLRAIPNSVRELQEHRRKRLDSALSVTEWARLMVLFGVDHASGFKNLFKVANKNPEKTVLLAHRLHTLAAVRNLVTHRASAGAATLAAFRRGYYTAFEDLVSLA